MKLTRRSLLLGVSLAAVAAGLLPSEMARSWTHGTTVPAFRGNPNVTITAIATAGVGTLSDPTSNADGTPATYEDVPLTGGSGTGATAQIVVSNATSRAFRIKIVEVGSGYAAGDTLSWASGAGLPSGGSTTVGSVGIAASRIAGNTPAFVQVSASAIKATGTSRPYEDLEFRWDFGDPTGTEILTDPVTGVSVNMNVQYGPEAVYPYRTDGSKLITLSIRGKNGNSWTVATQTMTFTVSTFTPVVTAYFALSQEASGGSGTQVDPYIGYTNLKTVVEAAIVGNATQVYIKRGTSYLSTNTTVRIDPKGPLRIEPYDSGAVPIVGFVGKTQSTGLFYISSFSGTLNPVVDVVISNIAVSSLPATGASAGTWDGVVGSSNGDSNYLRDLYFDNCIGYRADNPAQAGVSGTIVSFQAREQVNASGTDQRPLVGPYERMGYWNCQVYYKSSIRGGISILQGAQSWGFVVGGRYFGRGVQSTGDHHLYIKTTYHACYKMIDLSGYSWTQNPSDNARNFAINSSWNLRYPAGDTCYPAGIAGYPAGYNPHYMLIQACKIGNIKNGIDLSDDCNSNGGAHTSYWYDVVVEGCSFNNLGPFADQGYAVLIYSCAELTVRDCNGWELPQPFIYPTSNLKAVLNLQMYRCKLYSTLAAQASVITNTLLYSASSGLTVPLVFTDNTIYITATNSFILYLNVATLLANGSIIDRNRYYAPNTPSSGTTFMKDLGVSKTWAQWQALGVDVNSTVGDPGWINPAQGVF